MGFLKRDDDDPQAVVTEAAQAPHAETYEPGPLLPTGAFARIPVRISVSGQAAV